MSQEPKSLLQRPPKAPKVKLPATSQPLSLPGILMEIIAGAVGLAPDPEDPEMYVPGSPAQRQAIRAQAAGEMGTFFLPVGGVTSAALRRVLGKGGKEVDFLKSLPEHMRKAAEPYLTSHRGVMAKSTYAPLEEGAEGLGVHGIRQGGDRMIGTHPMLEQAPQFDRTYILGHELQHGQQSLQSPNFDESYDMLEALYGYERNPLEIDARKTGLTGANTQFWGGRATPEQPLLPGVVTPEGIAEWSGAVAKPYEWGSGSTISTPSIESMRLRLQGPRITDYPKGEDVRKQVIRQKFGSSPTPQPQLPMATPSRLGPEFTAVGDEPPRMPAQFQEPSRIPAQPPYRDPKFSSAREILGGDSPDSFLVDADPLKEFLGVSGRSPVQVKLRMGPKPAIVKLMPKPHFGGPRTENQAYDIVDVIDVSPEMLTMLSKKLELAKEGIHLDTRGVRSRQRSDVRRPR